MQYFVCSTNRPYPGWGGQALEVLMHENDFAAIWEYPEDGPGEVHYLPHMERVQRDNLIFMFAKGKGIIGVGRAQGPCRGPFPPEDNRRIRGNDWKAAEWQVPVVWLFWEPDNPCPFHGLNAAFYDVSGPRYRERREAVIQHFNMSDL